MANYRLLKVLILLMAALSTQAVARELIYIEANRSKDIHIIDATTFKPIGRIDIGFPTDDVVGSHDGKMVFGNASVPNGNPVGFPDAGAVYGISTATNKILWWCSIPGLPHHLTVSLNDKRLYVAALDKNYIYVIDTATGRLIDSWYSIIGNHGLELSADGKHLYSGNILLRRIDVYDTETGRLVKVMRTREAVRPFKIDKEERLIYYQLSNFHGFEVRDVHTGDLVRSVELPKLAPGLHGDANGTVDHGIALTPDGTKLLAAGSVGNYVAVYRLSDLKLLGTVPTGEEPNWIRVRSDSKVAFTGNPGSNDVSVIDLEQMKEIARVPAGQFPERFDIVDVK